LCVVLGVDFDAPFFAGFDARLGFAFASGFFFVAMDPVYHRAARPPAPERARPQRGGAGRAGAVIACLEGDCGGPAARVRR
jgi:hypothetical protein